MSQKFIAKFRVIQVLSHVTIFSIGYLFFYNFTFKTTKVYLEVRVFGNAQMRATPAWHIGNIRCPQRGTLVTFKKCVRKHPFGNNQIVKGNTQSNKSEVHPFRFSAPLRRALLVYFEDERPLVIGFLAGGRHRHQLVPPTTTDMLCGRRRRRPVVTEAKRRSRFSHGLLLLRWWQLGRLAVHNVPIVTLEEERQQ